MTAQQTAQEPADDMPFIRGDLEHLQGALCRAISRLGDAQDEAGRTYDVLKRIGALRPSDAAHADAVIAVIDLWLSDLSARADAVGRELAALNDPSVLRLPGLERG